MATETRQYLRDFNRLIRQQQRRASSTTECWKSIPIASIAGIASERSKHRQEAAKRHTATLTSGGPIAGGIVGECCEDFMTSTNTYDPKGRL